MDNLILASQQFQGLARIQLDSLNYEQVLNEAKHRPLSPRNVTRLRQVFDLEGCKYYDESNYISGIVPQESFDQHNVNLPLHSKDLDAIPHLEFSCPVRCLNGLHRICAAREHLDPNDRWWIVKLYTEGDYTPLLKIVVRLNPVKRLGV
ncbi:hypothetical protein BDV97DRAFT_299437 [Delphinella strobiligena]|nr:hypothetical protein BDV97DRAFT_299437 [Delphinella strobiligena]